MSIFAGITCPDKLAGIVGLSSYLLMEGKIKDYLPEENPNKETPIFMGHGDSDPLVKYEWGVTTAEVLKGRGWSVDLKTYKGLLHSAEPREIEDLEVYIQQRLPPLGDEGASTA